MEAVMGIGVSLFLIAVGAILTFALHMHHIGGVSVGVIGRVPIAVRGPRPCLHHVVLGGPPPPHHDGGRAPPPDRPPRRSPASPSAPFRPHRGEPPPTRGRRGPARWAAPREIGRIRPRGCCASGVPSGGRSGRCTAGAGTAWAPPSPRTTVRRRRPTMRAAPAATRCR